MAMNMQAIQGDWNHLCCLAKHAGINPTEDDLGVGRELRATGFPDSAETGEGRETIETFFAEMAFRGSWAVTHAAEAAGQYAHHVGRRDPPALRYGPRTGSASHPWRR